MAANGLVERGYKVRFVVLRDEGPFSSELSDSVSRLELLGRDRWSPPAHTQIAVATFRYRRACADGKRRIIISFSPITNLLALVAASLQESQYCILQEHAHQGVAIQDSSSYSKQFSILYKTLLARSYRFADHLICVSDSAREFLIHEYHLPSQRTSTVYNPIDVDGVVNLSQGETENWPRRAGIRIIAVGRLAPQKNFHRFLQVLATVRTKSPKSEFDAAILGDGPDHEALADTIAELGLDDAVRIVGFQENHYPYIKSADVICLTSEWEGLPYVLAEGMALGTIVVAHDCPSGPREMVTPGAGYLLPFNDVEGMANAILALQDAELRAQMSREAREFCRQTYSPKHFIDSYEEIFLRILK